MNSLPEQFFQTDPGIWGEYCKHIWIWQIWGSSFFVSLQCKKIETLAKILNFLADYSSLLRVLIISCLFLLHSDVLNFFRRVLVRLVSRISQKHITWKTDNTFSQLFPLPAPVIFLNSTKYWIKGRDRLVGSVKASDIIGTLFRPRLATCFSRSFIK